ncbi:hypothetical protein JOD63_001899 [Microbacterium terrae]|uniref:Fis family transcriptional regulator n=1 Tax=Microbacterium terrae TaxID=69369 RepID=A0A0M2HFR4_9MICO|nr:hypothetical protein [Microbacterium terrae]KJL43551.1 hypothetical protein RS81_00859 [Microbacterium terrae]MBP1077931.1 hypothetical protein [Microbacterium terrae]GLK00103.1 hypothetical protein GCM10017594_33000 [Microbacterium terrae]
MRWDRFFDDLEDQLASEWEAERASLDTEAERLRLSRLELRDRLAALAVGATEVSFDLAGGHSLRAEVGAVGADWAALALGRRRGLVPLSALLGIGMPHAELLRTARAVPARSTLTERMTFGFVLRDLVRRRAGVMIRLADGAVVTGTIDRAGADHLDLAVHEHGAPRRADAVTGFRIVPLAAVSLVQIEESDGYV